MYVVAGVTGHVGSVVAKQLLGQGKKVRVIVRDAAKGAPFAERGAEVAVGSIEDSAFLTSALAGASGFFVLLPPNATVPDFYGHQRKQADSIASAVKAAGVPHVVLLSSVGADLPDGTGPIKGLHYAEGLLHKTGTKLTAIRAGYFQENIGSSLIPAKQMGIVPVFAASADYPFPMIATSDIGNLAAESLLNPPAKSESIDLHGPAYSMRQLADKLGEALGKKLEVALVPQEKWVPTLEQAGLSRSLSEAYAEMYGAFGAGKIAPKGDRMVQGKTTVDGFIASLAKS
jgi:uncharacterized protein YbjT (DUF2867 family)